MAPRSLLIDGLKVVASQLIVLHHLLLYAPMANVVGTAWPVAAAFLAGDARFVVQIFLVIGGHLAAQGLGRRRDSLPRATSCARNGKNPSPTTRANSSSTTRWAARSATTPASAAAPASTS